MPAFTIQNLNREVGTNNSAANLISGIKNKIVNSSGTASTMGNVTHTLGRDTSALGLFMRELMNCFKFTDLHDLNIIITR